MKNLILPFLAIFLFASCQSQSNPKIKVIAPKEFKAQVVNKDVQLVDVRTPQEFQEGAIAHAKNINVNDAKFKENIAKLDKKKPVYIYCRSGGRSQTAAKIMVDLGFEQVIDLQGGYMNWN
ncbi:MAG: rhodanese-like domain-containing protein [Flavobacteriales bacterium]|jgi:rhodanese-related sulfurtransferase|nr:rhodanese-like domain-containing protein [Flavobacteriales bacterium]